MLNHKYIFLSQVNEFLFLHVKLFFHEAIQILI